MNADEEALLDRFEARVIQLTLEYRKLAERCGSLEAQLAEKETCISGLKDQVARLQADYANLKTAKMIDIGSGDMKDAKSRLSRLVREIDKCIALLNV